jgi:hypothetical protein
MATALILANRGHKLDEAPAVDEVAESVPAELANWTANGGQVRKHWTGPVATEADVAESEAAFRGEGLPSVADEAQSYLARLDTELDATTTPAHPLETMQAMVRAGSRAEVKAESVPGYAGNLIKAWAMADPDQRPRPGQVDQAVALACEVSPRQARRWRYALLGS